VAVAVGGGIAAYKAGDLVRELRRQGATVRVTMTRAACEFITPLTMQSLSGHAVYTEPFEPSQEENFGHLHLSRWADLFIVAPATGDLMARIRAGLANDAVTTALLAFKGPVLFAPAMNTAMWEHEQTQENLRALLSVPRYRFVGPGVGLLADGDVGAGRLAEQREIIEAAQALAGLGPLAGRHVLITAGPTREPMDPVRFISNPSTGKMGLALADAARARGARVTVVLGPVGEVPRDRHELVDVVTADDMAREVLARVAQVDCFVATAAVSDWRPATVAPQKVKKGEGPETLTLVRTPDVLAQASALVHGQPRRPLLVGFAAETHDVEAYAQGKLEKKRLDFIVANDVSRPGAGFGSDTNEVVLLGRDGARHRFQGSKRDVAGALWDQLQPAFFAKVTRDV
jgi:phosphopantothenoylcysteine decarboxylase/phosphopantothenate--cysteine ligase